MNRLATAFARLTAAQRRSLLPYITGGYPDVETTLAILRGLDAERCACAEIGIPFSDPIADGAVIQASFSRALERGFRLDNLLAGLRAARQEIAVPLIAMVSYSIVYRREPSRFVAALVQAGFDGLLAPDLSLEEAEDLAAICRRHACPLGMMVAPTTRPGRRERLLQMSEPFIYYQSLVGITGERDRLPHDLAENVRRLREVAGKPVCVGFGISRPEQVAAVCAVADGAIVGSAIVRRMNAAVDRGDAGSALAQDVLEFIRTLTAALPRD